MSAITALLRSLLGLFVEDELLAVGVLAVVGLTALLIEAAGLSPLAAGVGLLVGNALVLVIGVLRTAQRRPGPQ
jgi:hypothetical protein